VGKKRIIEQNEREVPAAAAGEIRVPKRSSRRHILKGIAHIFSSYNNTIITVTDLKGNVVTSASSGGIGFSGTRKSTPYAATLAAKAAAEKARPFGIIELRVKVNGIGPGREAAIRGLASAGYEITSITDVTPIPHNGVKPPKPRRM
jgi:small subunit ribosomal protein S11